jgi:hypothetical protein
MASEVAILLDRLAEDNGGVKEESYNLTKSTRPIFKGTDRQEYRMM